MARSPGSRGREADRPSEIPKAGWLDVLARVWGGIGALNLGMVAAGVAFSEFFALFPALAAAVSLYGLLADPATVESQMGALGGVLPGDVAGLVRGQMQQLAGSSGGSLGLSFGVAVVVALWGATSGVKALITGLDIVYREEEKRGFLRLNLLALGLTLAAIVFGLVALALVAGLPAVLGFLPLGEAGKTIASVLRWPLLAVLVLGALVVVYRYGPSRDRARWRWVSWGAAAAALLWLAGSALFSLYVGHFGQFNKTYGSFAAVAVLLLWFELTAFSVLLGGLLDAELERQTRRDSTTGEPEPMGRRGARAADTLGETRD
jgi:membrane protein